jgi:hypothetical protein
MDLTKAIDLYADSKEWQAKGFEAFIKNFGKVVWNPCNIETNSLRSVNISRNYNKFSKFASTGWGSAESLVIKKFSKDDKNYLLKFVMSIPEFDSVDEVLKIVWGDVTESTYDHVISCGNLYSPTWNMVQVKYERLKKEREQTEKKILEVERERMQLEKKALEVERERMQQEKKALEVEKAVMAKQLEEIRNKKRKADESDSEEGAEELEI